MTLLGNLWSPMRSSAPAHNNLLVKILVHAHNIFLEVCIFVLKGGRRWRNPVTFLLSDIGWCVHKSDVQNKGDDNEHTTHKHGNGDEDGNGNEDRIGDGGREAKKRKKPHVRVVDAIWGKGEIWVERKKCRKERVGPVGANPDNLEAGWEHKVLRA